MNAIGKVLVTGSNGTIGTALCECLLKEGYDIVGVDVTRNKWNRRVDEITMISDLRQTSFVDKLPKNFHLIVHLAANARVYELVKEPKLARDNFEVVVNILEFARLNNINIMFASSREVYGNTRDEPRRDDTVYVESCESPYAASKIGAEAFVHSYHRCYGIDSVILRFSNVYGKYDDSDRVIPTFIRAARKDEEIVVFGEEKLLDFTYIDDCVNGMMKCIERFENIKNNAFNIASGEGTRLSRVAELIIDQMGSKSKVSVQESRTGEIARFVADISKARKFLDYSPRVPIEEGIEKAIEWYDWLEREGCVSGL